MKKFFLFDLDGTRTDKAEVIGYALELLGRPDKSQVVMVGDRRHDIEGAKSQGVESIGVQYGYAEPGELQEAGADYLASGVEELGRLCLEMVK